LYGGIKEGKFLFPYLKIHGISKVRYERRKKVTTTPALPKRRRELNKSQTAVVLVIGALMFAQAFFISAEVGSTVYYIKNTVAIIGLVVGFAGIYLRPVNETPKDK
jgi:hypothetical protein